MSGDWRSYSNRVPSCSRCQSGHIRYKSTRAFTEEIMLVFLLMLSVFGQSTTVSGDVPIEWRVVKSPCCWLMTAHLCTSDRRRSGQRLPLWGFSWSFWSAASPCYNVLGSWEKIHGEGKDRVLYWRVWGFEYLEKYLSVFFKGLRGWRILGRVEEGQKSQIGQHCLASSELSPAYILEQQKHLKYWMVRVYSLLIVEE